MPDKLFISAYAFITGIAVGGLVFGVLLAPQKTGLISCTGYQTAFISDIRIRGNGLFRSNLDPYAAAQKIGRVICVDTDI